MRFELSCQILVLIACIAHELWTFLWEFSSFPRITYEWRTFLWDFSSDHMRRPCAIYEICCEILFQIACVNFLAIFFFFKSHAEPMSNELSCKILFLILVAFVAHELWTFPWGFSSFYMMMCSQLTMNFFYEILVLIAWVVHEIWVFLVRF